MADVSCTDEGVFPVLHFSKVHVSITTFLNCLIFIGWWKVRATGISDCAVVWDHHTLISASFPPCSHEVVGSRAHWQMTLL